MVDIVISKFKDGARRDSPLVRSKMLSRRDSPRAFHSPLQVASFYVISGRFAPRGKRRSFRIPHKKPSSWLFRTLSHFVPRVRRDSNPRPATLEIAALPAELHTQKKRGGTPPLSYFKILETVPAPIVRPPSRMAKRIPSSIAIGWMSSAVISTLSPGITISTPAGNSTVPVTSVVRK